MSEFPATRPDPPATPIDVAPEVLETIRLRTPARVLAGRAGTSYRTPTLLGLRQDHAAARDAVWAEVDLARDFGADLVERYALFEVRTRAESKEQYLLRPDLGRRLGEAGRAAVSANCPAGIGLQVVLGDGLSAAAVAARVPHLLPKLDEAARGGGWRVGRPFFVRYCRVGVMNDVGDVLDPEVVVLLIGERPGLATAESLSAYMAYRPRPGHTDAQRNLISNIHSRGVSDAEAITRVLALADQMRRRKVSGVAVKEERPDPAGPRLLLPRP
jgi:ethanolamine ammonia-lyase small subunit